jgi:hypothetical protein
MHARRATDKCFTSNARIQVWENIGRFIIATSSTSSAARGYRSGRNTTGKPISRRHGTARGPRSPLNGLPALQTVPGSPLREADQRQPASAPGRPAADRVRRPWPGTGPHMPGEPVPIRCHVFTVPVEQPPAPPYARSQRPSRQHTPQLLACPTADPAGVPPASTEAASTCMTQTHSATDPCRAQRRAHTKPAPSRRSGAARQDPRKPSRYIAARRQVHSRYTGCRVHGNTRNSWAFLPLRHLFSSRE